VLLLAPDSYTAFGLIFLTLVVGHFVSCRERLGDFVRLLQARLPMTPAIAR
jgi:hypothetical protein